MPEWISNLIGDLTVVQVLVWVIAVLLVVRLIYKGWPWLRGLVKLVDSLGKLPAFIDRTDQKISEIHHEVHYNNGSSVKDAVRRVETGVAGLYKKVDELTAADDEIRADIKRREDES